MTDHDSAELPDEIDCDPAWVDLVARAMVAQVGDDWDHPALTPQTPRAREEEFREDFRRAARQLLAVLANAGALALREPCNTPRPEVDEAVELLADLVAKCTEYGTQEGEFVAYYLLPTGPVHRAIPWLEQHGVTVRPGQPPTRPVRLRQRSRQEMADYLAAKRAELVQAGQSTEPVELVARTCGPHCIDGYWLRP
jgi:hypothetical protein